MFDDKIIIKHRFRKLHDTWFQIRLAKNCEEDSRCSPIITRVLPVSKISRLQPCFQLTLKSFKSINELPLLNDLPKHLPRQFELPRHLPRQFEY